MPLPTPNLDDRTFQDILDEARRRIPLYCPEWTDHNLSDPGITLLELFAWMTDLLLYRLNRVPEKNYIKFLELIGVRLQPAQPARTVLTFRLTAPQPEDIIIAQGTEVATVRTETREAVTFTTDRDLVIRVPRLVHLLTCRDGTRFHDYRPALENPAQGLGIFNEVPQADDALYFGFANDLSGHTLAFTLQCRMEGIGVDPNDPPLVWEAWDAQENQWGRLVVEQDTTGGLNRDGVVILYVPIGSGPTVINDALAFWVRCRALQPRPGQAGYSSSPRVTAVLVESIGGSVAASHAFKVMGEFLGVSDGTPGQTFKLQMLPVLPRAQGETLEVQREDGTFEPWIEVGDFGSSGPDDPHFVLDDATGTVELGPRLRSPDGRERQFGRVPPAGRALRFSTYRSGGGIVGNVGARTLTVLKSSVPYVAYVTNFEPAVGGRDAEDIEHAKWRGPQVLRATHRAVTPEDFETLALQASSAVGRARCLMVRGPAERAHRSKGPGIVRLLLVPAQVPSDARVLPEHLHLPARVKREVEEYLNERRLLTSELVLDMPAYTWVSVSVRVRARPQVERTRLAHAIASVLYRFLHPTVGGPDGTGWPFGRALLAGDIYTRLQDMPELALIEEIVLHEVDPSTGQTGPATMQVHLEADGLVCSYEHQVDVQPAPAWWV